MEKNLVGINQASLGMRSTESIANGISIAVFGSTDGSQLLKNKNKTKKAIVE